MQYKGKLHTTVFTIYFSPCSQGNKATYMLWCLTYKMLSFVYVMLAQSSNIKFCLFLCYSNPNWLIFTLFLFPFLLLVLELQ